MEITAPLAEMRKLDILAKDAEVRLLTDAYEGADGKVFPVLPSGYASYDWVNLGVKVTAQAVSPKVNPDEVGGMEEFTGKRDLHAKIVVLEGAANAIAYLGSANFTAHGWGFLRERTAANIEAGLILRVRPGMLKVLLPDVVGSPVALSEANLHLLVSPENSAADSPWPEFITAVLLSPSARSENELDLVIKVDADKAPTSWSVQLPAKDPIPGETLVLVTRTQGSPGAVFVLPLCPETFTRLLIEQQVWIYWSACPSGRAVPLNVESSARDRLPITPGNQAIDESHLISYYQGRLSWEDLFPDPENPIGPLAAIPVPAAQATEVDKSRIQSYQIREFVEALAGIRDDLKGATQSERSMRLALCGPVSPLTLAYTVIEAADLGRRTPMAAAFQLVEILPCLNAARSLSVPHKLSRAWKEQVAQDDSGDNQGEQLGLSVVSLPNQMIDDLRVKLQVWEPELRPVAASAGSGGMQQLRGPVIESPTEGGAEDGKVPIST